MVLPALNCIHNPTSNPLFFRKKAPRTSAPDPKGRSKGPNFTRKRGTRGRNPIKKMHKPLPNKGGKK